MATRPLWLQKRDLEALRLATPPPPPEPEVIEIDARSIIATKPDIDVVRDYFRAEVEDLAMSDSSSFE